MIIVSENLIEEYTLCDDNCSLCTIEFEKHIHIKTFTLFFEAFAIIALSIPFIFYGRLRDYATTNTIWAVMALLLLLISWLLMTYIVIRHFPLSKPVNVVILIINDLSMAYLMAFNMAFHVQEGYLRTVLVSFTCSVAVFAGLAVFTCFSGREYTVENGFAFGITWGIIFWFLLSLWNEWPSGYILSFLGTFVYTGSMAYSVELIFNRDIIQKEDGIINILMFAHISWCYKLVYLLQLIKKRSFNGFCKS